MIFLPSAECPAKFELVKSKKKQEPDIFKLRISFWSGQLIRLVRSPIVLVALVALTASIALVVPIALVAQIVAAHQKRLIGTLELSGESFWLNLDKFI